MTPPFTVAQVQALAGLRAGLPSTEFVLIGAAALGCHVCLPRSTADLDLVIVIAPTALDAALAPLGWQRDERMLQRWRGPDGVVADLLPATPDLIAAGEFSFDDGARAMSLVGFDLALRHTVMVPLASTGVSINAATLPVLVVLKMVAWLDRPYERTRDLGDIAHVLDEALAADDERRWDPDHPVFQSGVDHEDQSAFFVGHTVAQIARDDHRAKVATFLDRVSDTNGVAFATMVRAANIGGDDPDERLIRRLAAFRHGLVGTATTP